MEALRQEAEDASKEARELLSREKDRKRKKEDSKSKEKTDKEEPEAMGENPLVHRGQKKIAEVFGDTGLDPRPSTRKKWKKKAKSISKKHKKKKKKGGSKSSSSRSTSRKSSEESEGVHRDGDKSMETSMVKKMAKRTPGVLTAAWVRECQDYLMTSQGQMWSIQVGEVPPLAVQYFRTQVAPRMSGPMAREYHSWAYCLDLLLQGRIAEGADLITQRLKSLSSTNSGIHYQVSQKLELLPQEKANPASLEETQEAAKSARQEEMVYAKASKAPRQWGANQGGEPPRGGKGKEGKGKKGKGRDGKSRDEGKGAHQDGKK